MIDWGIIRRELLSNRPLLIYDSSSRESETDMVFYAESIDYSKIAFLRREAGGLICFVSGKLFREVLNLPFMRDVLIKDVFLKQLCDKNPKYGDSPAFNLWVNHINTATGITDRDRALTINRLYEVAKLVYKGYSSEARELFTKEFYAPGHVPILTSRGLAYRKGHTELATVVALMTKLIPAMVITEMLSEGSSLPYEDARKYALRNNYVFLEGIEIIDEAVKRGLIND